MIYHVWLVAFATLVCGAEPAEAAPELSVTMTPLRATYHVGEPIAVLMATKNTSDRAIDISYDYPSFMATDFAADSQETPRSEQRFVAQLPGYSSRHRLPPGGEVKHVIALNRFVAFTRPGEYAISFHSRYLGSREEARERKARILPIHEARGKFVIDVGPGNIDEKWIEELIRIAEGRQAAPASPERADAVKITKEEAFEMLLWADTPMVIDPLIQIAKAMPHQMSGSAADAVKALRKFFKQHERARSGILEIASGPGSFDTLPAALALFEAEQVEIPAAWFQPILASNKIQGRWVTLGYLRKHGHSDDIPLIEPLVADRNAQIAELARAVVAELKARPPAAPATEAAPKSK